VTANGAAAARVLVFMSSRARGQYVQQAEMVENSVTLLKPVNAAGILDALAGVERQAVAPAVAAPLRGARILLVEDNPLNQFVARGVLEQAGAEVESANDGREALAMLEQAPERFQLILMDVQMPGMDGYAATRAIRQERGLRTPIIAMSAGVLSFEREQCVEAGMDDFVAKPLDVERMLACLVRHLPAEAPAPAAKFDLSKLLRNLKPAQQAMLGGLVRRVVQQIPADLEVIRQACSGGSPRAASPVLHSLRGSVGSFGARDFVAAALALEALIASGEQTGLQDGLELVEHELTQTREAALAWLAANTDPALADGAPTAAPQQLARFEQLLGERNIDACELLEELRGHFASAHGEAFVAAMEQHMSGLEFEAALRLLKMQAA
jgi:two-component system sensor histidine kinase/response regulator